MSIKYTAVKTFILYVVERSIINLHRVIILIFYKGPSNNLADLCLLLKVNDEGSIFYFFAYYVSIYYEFESN